MIEEILGLAEWVITLTVATYCSHLSVANFCSHLFVANIRNPKVDIAMGIGMGIGIGLALGKEDDIDIDGAVENEIAGDTKLSHDTLIHLSILT